MGAGVKRESTDLLVLYGGLPLGDDLPGVLELAALEGLLRVDDLVRPRRVLEDARPRRAALVPGQLAL